MRERRTREYIIADLSVNHVEHHALLCGYAVEHITHNYGIDLTLTTYPTEEKALLLSPMYQENEQASLINLVAAQIAVDNWDIADRNTFERMLAENTKQRIAAILYMQRPRLNSAAHQAGWL